MHAIDVDDECGFFECVLDIAVFPNAVPDFVRAGFFVEDAAVFQRLFCIDHRVQRFVLDRYEFGGIVGDGGRLCHHGGYGLSLIAGFLNCHRIVANFLSVVGADLNEWLGLRGDFLAGDRTHHAWQGLGGGGVHADDAGMRVGGAHETQVEHLVQFDVVREFAAAAQQAVFLFAGKRCAYPAIACGLFFFTHSIHASNG